MNASPLHIALGVIVVAALGGAAGYWLAHRSAADNVSPAASATAPDERTETRKPLYWYDPMMPSQHFDQPGKSPFMDMQLVPKYADEPGDGAGVKIDARTVQNLGVRYATVQSGQLAATNA